ncbi:hypothetical protein FIBSPDRAFT_881855 [Athelia psychrophila]|uniref:Uncharacterized protein n=1 Tax=Athelia psychrophila TaxID=1759441 RepID=A0A166VTY1_9AGAM|nr:hypothetical protein FIBSPDRAFT_881855 [Fibularhizoctonia sp. CBS 109695]
MAHPVAVSLPLWGCTRPLYVLITKVQNQSNLKCLVTVFVAESLLAKVENRDSTPILVFFGRIAQIHKVTGSAPVIIQHYCPGNVGGLGDVAGRAQKAAVGTGKEYERMVLNMADATARLSAYLHPWHAGFDYECFPEGKHFQPVRNSPYNSMHARPPSFQNAAFIETQRSRLSWMSK